MTWAFPSNVPTVPRSSITNYAHEQIVETLSLWLHSGGVVFIKLLVSWIIIRYWPIFIAFHLSLSLSLPLCFLFPFPLFFPFSLIVGWKLCQKRNRERSLQSLASEVSLPNRRWQGSMLDIGRFCFLQKVIRMWSRLPDKVVETGELNKFKGKEGIHLQSCNIAWPVHSERKFNNGQEEIWGLWGPPVYLI